MSGEASTSGNRNEVSLLALLHRAGVLRTASAIFEHARA